MMNRGLPLHINPTMRYRYDSYWGTWNRVLQFPTWYATEHRPLQMIEFSMTPIGDDWEDLASIRIRKHGTPFSATDKTSNVIPAYWWDHIGEKIGVERRDFMAYHNNFLDEIDWVKYHEINNGGAPFDLIRKG